MDQMDHIPDLYRSIIDDPAALHNAFEQAKGEGNYIHQTRPVCLIATHPDCVVF